MTEPLEQENKNNLVCDRCGAPFTRVMGNGEVFSSTWCQLCRYTDPHMFLKTHDTPTFDKHVAESLAVQGYDINQVAYLFDMQTSSAAYAFEKYLPDIEVHRTSRKDATYHRKNPLTLSALRAYRESIDHGETDMENMPNPTKDQREVSVYVRYDKGTDIIRPKMRVIWEQWHYRMDIEPTTIGRSVVCAEGNHDYEQALRVFHPHADILSYKRNPDLHEAVFVVERSSLSRVSVA